MFADFRSGLQPVHATRNVPYFQFRVVGRDRSLMTVTCLYERAIPHREAGHTSPQHATAVYNPAPAPTSRRALTSTLPTSQEAPLSLLLWDRLVQESRCPRPSTLLYLPRQLSTHAAKPYPSQLCAYQRIPTLSLPPSAATPLALLLSCSSQRYP